jgi:hypothetical protein
MDEIEFQSQKELEEFMDNLLYGDELIEDYQILGELDEDLLLFSYSPVSQINNISTFIFCDF